jgi:uncharacterized phage protein (TIGR01671 family)
MREGMGKYRGVSIESGEWKYGYYNCYVCPESGEGFHSISDGDLDIEMINPDTLGQLTGLQDKDGKDIYEGDHVGTCSNGYKWSIEWGSFGDAGFYACNGLNSCRRLDVVYGDAVFTVSESQQIICKVIGNIHDGASA